MKTNGKNKKNMLFGIIFLAVAFFATVAATMTGSFLQDKYNVHVDSVSPKRFTAPRQVENEVATEKLRESAMASVVSLYKHDPIVKDRIIAKADTFFDEIGSLRINKTPIYNPLNENISAVEPDDASGSFNEMSVYLSNDQYKRLVDMNSGFYIVFKDTVYSIADNILETGIKEEAMAKSLVSVKDEFEAQQWDSADKNLGYEIVASVLEPNLVIDEQSTQRAKDEAADAIRPVVYYEGQNIVDKGEVITEEIYAVLDALGYTGKSLSDNVVPIIGSLVIIIVLFVVASMYIYYFNFSLVLSKKAILLLFTLYTACVVSARLMINMPFQFMPIVLFSMLTAILLDSRLAVAFNICLSIICSLIVGAEIQFIVYFIIVGIFASILAKYTTQRNKTLIVGLYLSIISFAVMFAFGSLFDKAYSNDLINNSIFAALSGLLAVILCIGTLPLWEVLFGIVTPIKLLDYTNPNNGLLRRLTIEAPGTYHHSLIVANLAETAAYDIGANPTLARVGAYYHDIGKLKFPQYFAENQLGENPHDVIDPYASAKVITGHVAKGVEMAHENRLPKIICDIIEQHHGNTMIKYFYVKASKLYEDRDIDEKDFRYKFAIPQFKESAIVMLADTIEAAVRSMINKSTLEQVETFIKTLIKDKLDDGQLTDSMLTIKDLDVIASSFMRVFKGMYHERIPYPKATMAEIKQDLAEGEPAGAS